MSVATGTPLYCTTTGVNVSSDFNQKNQLTDGRSAGGLITRDTTRLRAKPPTALAFITHVRNDTRLFARPFVGGGGDDVSTRPCGRPSYSICILVIARVVAREDASKRARERFKRRPETAGGR